MKNIPYKKPTNWKGGNGFTKGIKTGPMKCFFKEGTNPYKAGQLVIVMFKQNKIVALVEGVNEQSITVQIKGVDRKKVIRYNNIIEIVKSK